MAMLANHVCIQFTEIVINPPSIILASPEAIVDRHYRKLMASKSISVLVLDEVHCVHAWYV